MTIDRNAQFAAWLEANPHVYQAFVAKALAAKAAGRDRWSVDAIMNELRWENGPRPRSRSDGYAFNNHFRSRLARLVMARHQQLAGFFELRERKTPGRQAKPATKQTPPEAFGPLFRSAHR